MRRRFSGGGRVVKVCGAIAIASVAVTEASLAASAPAPPPIVPTARIVAPTAGSNYVLGEIVHTSFVCTEGANGPGIASCADSAGGRAPYGLLDTRTVGHHSYTVTATSQDGLTSSTSRFYDVVADVPLSARTTRLLRAVGLRQADLPQPATWSAISVAKALRSPTLRKVQRFARRLVLCGRGLDPGATAATAEIASAVFRRAPYEVSARVSLAKSPGYAAANLRTLQGPAYLTCLQGPGVEQMKALFPAAYGSLTDGAYSQLGNLPATMAGRRYAATVHIDQGNRSTKFYIDALYANVGAVQLSGTFFGVGVPPPRELELATLARMGARAKLVHGPALGMIPPAADTSSASGAAPPPAPAAPGTVIVQADPAVPITADLTIVMGSAPAINTGGLSGPQLYYTYPRAQPGIPPATVYLCTSSTLPPSPPDSAVTYAALSPDDPACRQTVIVAPSFKPKKCKPSILDYIDGSALMLCGLKLATFGVAEFRGPVASFVTLNGGDPGSPFAVPVLPVLESPGL
jgi:hypothetical protein